MQRDLSAIALFVTIVVTSCSKHVTPPGMSTAPPFLSVTGFSPNNGPDSTLVTITGTAFKSTIADDSVYFNGRAATIVSATDSTLVAIVPELAGTGNVSVKVNANVITSGTFFYDTSYRVSTLVDGLNGPFYLAIDTAGILYVSLYGNGTIVKIDTSGSTTTFANLPATGLAIDIHNNLFAAVASGAGILLDKISPTGDTTIIGGTIGFDLGLAVDTSDNLYFCNVTQNLVEKISPRGILDTIASGLFSPSGIGVALNGAVYVANYSVSAYDNADGALTAISPTGNVSTYSTMDYDGDAGILVDGFNDIYVTIENQQSATGWIEKVLPTGTPIILPSANLNFPCGIVRDKKANLYVVQQIDAPGATLGSVVKMTPY
jgi:hypothetical protein